VIFLLIDNFGRPVRSLRISVTQKCNYNCIYCHMEGINYNVPNEMTAKEIERVSRILVKFDIKKVKITGGEPLIRKDIIEIIEAFKKTGMNEISMSTNGSLLKELAKPLRKAGLNRVNISLPSLKKEVYEYITGGGKIENALEGIDAAIEAKLIPIKINTVILKGINENEIYDFINFSKDKKVILQLIELVETTPDFYKKYHLSLDKYENEIKEKALKIEIRSLHNRKKYKLKNGAEIEFVKPMHNSLFCLKCDRIRITPDGKFKTCLFVNNGLIDFLTPMRNGENSEKIIELLKKAVSLRKPYFAKPE
jgi:cyclic pyranopterin phosphate synthase